MHRLGLRTIQFATQTGYNAFSDSALAPLQGGAADRHLQGHQRARPRAGARDEPARHADRHHARHRAGADAADRGEPRAGGREPRHAARRLRRRHLGRDAEGARRQGRAGRHPRQRAPGRPALSQMDGARSRRTRSTPARAVGRMVGYMPSAPRPPGDRGEYIARFDEEFRQRWRDLVEWQEMPEAESLDPDRGRMGRAGRLRDQDGRRGPRRDRARHGRRPQRRCRARRRATARSSRR